MCTGVYVHVYMYTYMCIKCIHLCVHVRSSLSSNNLRSCDADDLNQVAFTRLEDMDYIDCMQILSKVKDGASAIEGLISAAENQAFILATMSIEKLRFEGGIENVTAIQLMRYGSILGKWAVEDSDLDVVAVICTDTDNEERRSALEMAFLCVFYLQLWDVEHVKSLKNLIDEKRTVSYHYFRHENKAESLKVDFSVQISSNPEDIPWRVRLTRFVKNVLTNSQVGDVALDIARIIITWAKKKGHCHNGNTTSNLHISSSQYRLRSIHWAILVAYALQLSADLTKDSLPIQVRTVLKCIGNM